MKRKGCKKGEIVINGKCVRFDKVEPQWLKQLRGKKLPGRNGNWEFVGWQDPSGVWYWLNRKAKYMVAATPFWSNGNDIQVEKSGEREYSYLKVLKPPNSPTDYLNKMKSVLKKL